MRKRGFTGLAKYALPSRWLTQSLFRHAEEMNCGLDRGALMACLAGWALAERSVVPSGFTKSDVQQWTRFYLEQNVLGYWLRRGEITKLGRPFRELLFERIDTSHRSSMTESQFISEQGLPHSNIRIVSCDPAENG